MNEIVGLGGGIGASRLWRAVVAAVDPSRLTLVVNTADDLWMHGLRICPDLDTTLYALSGRQDLARGWGIRNESFRCMEALRGLGHPVWFNLGDLDLATHLLRTGLLRDGVGLAEVTSRLAKEMGLQVRVLPMTEDEVTTRVQARGGRSMHYQEFLVQHRAELPVHRVCHEGVELAEPTAGLAEAIAKAAVIILAPSNPVASIEPILALPGVREAICRATAPVVAVSPIVSGVPIAEPGERVRAASRAALLAAFDASATASAVAHRYRDICQRFVLDTADAAEAEAVRGLGMEPVIVPTLLHHGAPAGQLVDAVLGLLR